MSTEIAQTVEAELLPSFEEARARADNIKRGVEDFFTVTVPTVQLAWQLRDWDALGYKSWDEYVEKEIGGALPRLDKDSRLRTVASLRELGMSTTAIAPIVGTSADTVERDVKRVAEDSSSGEGEDVRVITAMDGKVIDKDNPKRFTCSVCGKRRRYESRVEIGDDLYCEECAEAVDAAQADAEAEAEPEPKVKAVDPFNANYKAFDAALWEVVRTDHKWSKARVNKVRRTLNRALESLGKIEVESFPPAPAAEEKVEEQSE